MPVVTLANKRVLVIDDNESIHIDFRRVLEAPPPAAPSALDDLEASLFGAAEVPVVGDEPHFSVDSAFQGEQGFHKIVTSLRDGQPYAVAFVDMRMPPGWDGLETIRRLREVDRNLEVVICTAYTDYTWDDIVRHVGSGERIHMVTKPYEVCEIRRLTGQLAARWGGLN